MDFIKSFFLDGKLPFNRKWVSVVAFYILPLGLMALLAYFYYLGKSVDIQEDLGEWALNTLIFLLVIGPLSKIFVDFGILRTMSTFRKEIGIAMFYFALAHGLAYVPFGWKLWSNIPNYEFPLYIKFGLAAFLCTAVLYVTSNVFSIKLLGKKWFYLHKLVYGVLLLALLHLYFIDPEEKIEILLIAGVIVLLKFLSWKKVKLRILK